MAVVSFKRGAILVAVLLLAAVFLVPFSGTAEAVLDECVASGGMGICFPPEMTGDPGSTIESDPCKPRPWGSQELCP